MTECVCVCVCDQLLIFLCAAAEAVQRMEGGKGYGGGEEERGERERGREMREGERKINSVVH